MFSRRSRILIAVAFCLGVLVMLPPVSTVLKTGAMAVSFAFPHGAWRPLQLFTSAPTVTSIAIPEGTGSLIVDVYVPAGDGAHPAMLIYTPVLKTIRTSPKITNVADTLARAGFAVIIPDNPPNLSPFNDKEIPRLKKLIDAALDDSKLRIDRIGIFSICYGNGAAFAVAADPEYREKIDFLFAYSPHFDMQNAFSYLLDGTYAYGDIAGKSEPVYTARILLRAFFHQVGIEPAAFREHPVFVDARARLSPMSYVRDIRVPVYLLHAYDDAYIPYTESMRLHDALLADGKDSELLLTTMISHNGFRNFAENKAAYFKEIPQFVSLLFTFVWRHS